MNAFNLPTSYDHSKRVGFSYKFDPRDVEA